MQALEDVEKEIRFRFGFSEREDLFVPQFMDCGAKMEVQDGE